MHTAVVKTKLDNMGQDREERAEDEKVRFEKNLLFSTQCDLARGAEGVRLLPAATSPKKILTKRLRVALEDMHRRKQCADCVEVTFPGNTVAKPFVDEPLRKVLLRWRRIGDPCISRCPREEEDLLLHRDRWGLNENRWVHPAVKAATTRSKNMQLTEFVAAPGDLYRSVIWLLVKRVRIASNSPSSLAAAPTAKI